jgi:hypothetical protein
MMKLRDIRLPLGWVEWLCQKRLMKRPHFLCIEVAEAPLDSEIRSDLLYREVRKTFPKWAHFKCPRCGEHAQIPIAPSQDNWTVSIDWLNRPTVEPSIWELSSCKAHFFVSRGELEWCAD